jgi:hypothetical protein
MFNALMKQTVNKMVASRFHPAWPNWHRPTRQPNQDSCGRLNDQANRGREAEQIIDQTSHPNQK